MGTSTINLLITGGWGSGFSQQNPNWTTTINGSQNGSVISVDSNSYLQLWIQYFTLTGGRAERGGAVYIRSQGAGPVLTELHLVDNVINGNSARYDGGAIYAINYFLNSSLIINLIGNTITNNRCNWYSDIGDGGAISTRCYDGQLTFRARGNEISDNIASTQGGGVFVYTKNGNATTTATFEKNIISENRVGRAGGGILVDSWDSGQSTVSLINNIIADNTASRYGGGAFFNSESGAMEASLINNTITRNSAGSNGGGFNARSVALTGGTLRVDVKNSIVWGNTSSEDIHVSGDTSTSSTVVTASYSDLGDVHVVGGVYNPGAGNINANPYFLDYPGGDYHLEMGSPCIDSGICYSEGRRIAPFDDFEGDDRDNFCDIGADEWVSCSLPIGHIDYCRDCGPCAAGQGDCDSDSECQSGLTCAQVTGTDTCQASTPVCPHPVGHLDYCRDCGPCAAGEGDCDVDGECDAGLTCVQVTGTDTCQTSTPVCPHPVGHLDYCKDCGPCTVGQGDCDNDGECQSGLICAQVPGTDTCEASACPHPLGHLDYCRDCGPCAAGQGDCDSDSECQSGLTCAQVTGTDTCQVSACPLPVGHLDYCRDCGPCAYGQGDCDIDGECQSGLICAQIPGVDTCQNP